MKRQTKPKKGNVFRRWEISKEVSDKIDELKLTTGVNKSRNIENIFRNFFKMSPL